MDVTNLSDLEIDLLFLAGCNLKNYYLYEHKLYRMKSTYHISFSANYIKTVVAFY